MKTRIFALAVALAMPAMLPAIPAQAATPTDIFPNLPPGAGIGVHHWTQDPTVFGGNCFCGMSVGTDITLHQWNNETNFFDSGPTVSLITSAESTFTFTNNNQTVVFGPPMIRLESFGMGFLVVGEYDFFTFVHHSLGNGFSISQNITDSYPLQTPLPAALPLFAAGLGVVTFLARRKKTKAVTPT